jgi:hypothetical protein
VNGTSFLDAEGRMLGAVMIARDITKQREAAEQVRGYEAVGMELGQLYARPAC